MGPVAMKILLARLRPKVEPYLAAMGLEWGAISLNHNGFSKVWAFSKAKTMSLYRFVSFRWV